MRIPIKATAREPINRPDTYQRLPLSTHNPTCDQQLVHTFAPEAVGGEFCLGKAGLLSRYK